MARSTGSRGSHIISPVDPSGRHAATFGEHRGVHKKHVATKKRRISRAR